MCLSITFKWFDQIFILLPAEPGTNSLRLLIGVGSDIRLASLPSAKVFTGT